MVTKTKLEQEMATLHQMQRPARSTSSGPAGEEALAPALTPPPVLGGGEQLLAIMRHLRYLFGRAPASSIEFKIAWANGKAPSVCKLDFTSPRGAR